MNIFVLSLLPELLRSPRLPGLFPGWFDAAECSSWWEAPLEVQGQQRVCQWCSGAWGPVPRAFALRMCWNGCFGTENTLMVYGSIVPRVSSWFQNFSWNSQIWCWADVTRANFWYVVNLLSSLSIGILLSSWLPGKYLHFGQRSWREEYFLVLDSIFVSGQQVDIESMLMLACCPSREWPNGGSDPCWGESEAWAARRHLAIIWRFVQHGTWISGRWNQQSDRGALTDSGRCRFQESDLLACKMGQVTLRKMQKVLHGLRSCFSWNAWESPRTLHRVSDVQGNKPIFWTIEYLS